MPNPKTLHPQPATNAPVRVRRGYFECRFGQLHVHHAMPAGGGFDESTPLLALHAAGRSGAMFEGLLSALGRDRSVFAPDLPGFGGSDAPTALSVAEQAAALGDFLGTMRLRQVDLLGCGLGAHVALDLAAAHPAVRRIVITALPTAATPTPPQSAESIEAYLRELWAAARADCGAGAPLATLMSVCAERLRGGIHAAHTAPTERDDSLGERIRTLNHPLLVLHTHEWPRGFDSLAADVPMRSRRVLSGDMSLFQTEPQAIAAAVQNFLTA